VWLNLGVNVKKGGRGDGRDYKAFCGDWLFFCLLKSVDVEEKNSYKKNI